MSRPINQDDRSSPRVVLLATDRNQSTIGEISNGQTNTIGYSAYGEQSARQKVATRLGFNGQLREADIGWYLLGNGYRAYNPRLMRFQSPDSWSPFGTGGLNSYAYCGGNPVLNKDPTGHMFLSVLDDLIQRIVVGSRSLGMQTGRAVNGIQNTIAQTPMRVNRSGGISARSLMNGPGPGGPYSWPNNPPLTPGPSSAPYPAPKPPVSKMNGPGPGGPYSWPNNPPLTPGPSSAPYPAPKPPVSKMNGPGPGGPYSWPNNPPLTPGPSSAPYPAPKPPVSKVVSAFSGENVIWSRRISEIRGTGPSTLNQ